MRKSKFVAWVFAGLFFAMIGVAIFLKKDYNNKLEEWASVGETTIEEDGKVITVRLDPINRDKDTRNYKRETYWWYVFGHTVTGDDIQPKHLADPKNKVEYDDDGRPISVFIAPEGKAAPFKAEEFLLEFMQYRWCLIPTAKAATYASWLWFLKYPFYAGLVILPIGWFIAIWVSKQPPKDKTGGGRSGSRGRGRRVYRGNIFQRVGGFFKRRRTTQRRRGGATSRGSGQRRSRG